MTDVRKIDVDYIARVEGEGEMHVKVVDGVIEDVWFGIFEPPRFYEAFMVGRPFSDAPDITARICGICPVAYQMSSVHAMEYAFGTSVSGQLRALRRLLYCGEYIESHALHVYLLHAPDFLGYHSGIELAADHKAIVERGLHLKQVGTEIVRVLGGREIHPINVKVGGFWRLPTKAELDGLATQLDRALDEAIATVAWVAAFDFPNVQRPVEFVSLYDDERYPYIGRRIRSTNGIDIPIDDWNDTFVEEHVERSNALHAKVRDRGMYAVGPTARFSLNHEVMHPKALQAAAEADLKPGVPNPFRSIVVRAVETVEAIEEALAIIDAFEPPETAAI